MKIPFFILSSLLVIFSCKKDKDIDVIGEITIDSLYINQIPVANNAALHDIELNDVTIRMKFHQPVDTTLFNQDKLTITGGVGDDYLYWFDQNKQYLNITITVELEAFSTYRIYVETGQNLGGTFFTAYSFTFSTGIDRTPKFPVISQDSLLTLVQRKTFDYFWEYAHPVSGLSRDRLGGGDIVTTGGSGFGVMAIITGIHRGFITRSEGFSRVKTMVEFLLDPETEKFHGAFPHWLNGTTGKAYPFSTYDDGGDLVETALLMQGLLTAREYFIGNAPAETNLRDSIQKLWENVEWDWYQNSQNKLFWHWSPNHGWRMNMAVSGWNEALIVYVLAAASPTHSITREVYDEGWARNGSFPMLNGNTYYGIPLPLGPEYGGPLFFAHYSFLGLDPRNLSDEYANYWEQNTAHTLINRAYCIANPRGYAGYGPECWGLTASDVPSGYNASSPSNDAGVIAPTAAISSIPYTSDESMAALEFFYYALGDKLWGEYGFYDAFSLGDKWFASSYLAIDQGPIVCMIENYRSALLWNLFMSNKEITDGLTKLGFTY